MKEDGDATLPGVRGAHGADRDPEATYSPHPVVSTFEILFSTAGEPDSQQDAPPPCDEGTGRVSVPRFPAAPSPVSWDRHDLNPRRTIGRGGQGEIWEAVQVSLNRTIAVKRLLGTAGSGKGPTTGEQRESFVREAMTAARLEHPNIVPVHDLKETTDGSPLLVMKRLEGRPWSEALAQDAAELQEADFLARHLGVLVSVARAVAYAHGQGVIHRDLKPAQVILGSFGEVTLLDWGLATSFRASAEGDWIATPVATAGSPSGTPAYMAPEQTRDDPSGLGPWTDVYLLGGILWLIAAGVRPHEAATLDDVYAMAARGEIAPPSPRRHSPSDLLALARAALAPNPPDRPASALEFLRRLEAIVTGATRRQEARRIAAAARPVLDRADDGLYAELPGLRAELARARLLAPEDEEVAAVEDAAAQRLAAEALRRDDLGFARFAAGSVAVPARRQELLEAVAAGEARKRRERTQRRLALGATGLLLVAGLAGALFFLAEERRLGDEARRQKERAHALSGFLVESFTRRLEELGRHDLLAAVTEPVVRHYRDDSAGELTPAEALEYARALRLSAEALAAGTDAPEALRRADEAAAILSSLDETSRGKEGTLRLGRVYRTRASVQAELGRTDEALADARAALATVESLSRKEPASAEVALALAGARAALVGRLWAAGRHGGADAEAKVALAAVERAVALAPGDLAAARQQASFVHAESVRALTDGRVEDAERLATRATSLAEELVRTFPGSTLPLSLLASAHGSAVMALAVTSPADGAERSKAGVVAAKTAMALEPSSRSLRLDVGLALARSGYALLKAGRTAEAEEPLEEANRILDELLARDARRLPKLLAKGLVLRLQALVAWHSRDPDRALGLVADSRKTLQDAAAVAPDSLEAVVRLANAALDEGAMLNASGRGREAVALLEGVEARLALFFSDRNPGAAARSSRARLLAALGRGDEAGALLAAGSGQEGRRREAGPIPKPDLSLSSLRFSF